MIIGIPKEIKNNENRVSLTPSGAKELTKRGHKVYVQATAGANSGFPDKDYVAAGAELLPTIEEVYAKAEMIIKVKEPIEPEYKLIRQGQLVFTYFHFASSEPLTRAMVESGAICCAYETVEASDRSLPLLIPMSEVAGRMATQEGCYFLEKPHGGKGKLLGGMPGVKPAKVFVIGAGVVGTAAARMAAGLGADVTICDISLKRLAYLTDVMPQNVKTLMSSEYNIREELKTADLVIGSVLIPGAKAPKLVTRDMLRDIFVRTGEHDVGDAETEDFVGLLEESLGFGDIVVEVFAHADGLSALTRKYVCVFHSFCQNIFWLPGKDSKYFLTFALQRFTRGYAPSD